MSRMSHIEIIVDDLANHPQCPHGPTILFSRASNGNRLNFFACSACRDRRDCSFYLCESDKNKVSDVTQNKWKEANAAYINGINHRKLFLIFNKIHRTLQQLRSYCHTCSEFVLLKHKERHMSHTVTDNIRDYVLSHPSELLRPLDNPKKEAQFLFSKTAVKTIVEIIRQQNFKNILCIGAPRVHEFIATECGDMTSLMLDIDHRYHSFFGPHQFCWYNMFNNHLFLESARLVFRDFLTTASGKDLVIIMDPPFGGRIELLAQTIKSINQLNGRLNNITTDIPVLFIFPYFMEPQILNSFPDFTMLDYKVDYDNHPLFRDVPKGRKLGSPVRIFTNVNASLIDLPAEQGYKYCTDCVRWVADENKHCKICNACTSKNGRTYTHCNKCNRCVKPTWIHCSTCERCAQVDHQCHELVFDQTCFHCKEPGHKKRDCPKVNHVELHRKRKLGLKTKSKKLKTCNNKK